MSLPLPSGAPSWAWTISPPPRASPNPSSTATSPTSPTCSSPLAGPSRRAWSGGHCGDRPATSPRAKLEAGIDAYIATIEASPELYRFVAASLAGPPDGEDILGDYASVVGLHASRVIGEFMREAGVDSGAADPWGFGIVGLVRAATDRWLEQGRPLTREDPATLLTALIWPGLTRPGAGLPQLMPASMGERADGDRGGRWADAQPDPTMSQDVRDAAGPR